MRYEPLRVHLTGLAGPTVTLSYAEMEGLLGRKLPPSAYGGSWRQWWANTETHSQGTAWLRAGWRVSRPDLANKRVEFRRCVDEISPLATSVGCSGGSTSADGDDQRERIVLFREYLTPGSIRMLEDAAEETDGDLGRAASELLNQASMARRRQLLDWFAAHSPRSTTSSAEMIREDRDAR